MRWRFPSKAARISADKVEDESFRQSLAKFIFRASVEEIAEFAATTVKAGASVPEVRDTADPALIGQLLMSLLSAYSTEDANETMCQTQKHVRDEVCWSKGADKPWRRSPTWLVARVSMQRILFHLFGACRGIVYYKFFICFVVAQICQGIDIQPDGKADLLDFARRKLAGRLLKLSSVAKDSSSPFSQTTKQLFEIMGPLFERVMSSTSDRLSTRWIEIQRSTIKTITPLARRAGPEDTRLSLRQSYARLMQILSVPLTGNRNGSLRLTDRGRKYDEASAWSSTPPSPSLTFSDCFYLLAYEADVRKSLEPQQLSTSRLHNIVEIVENMDRYRSWASQCYTSDPEQLSQMLLTLAEGWMLVDKLTVVEFPLLTKYSPELPSSLLTPILSRHPRDSDSARAVELHLERRHNERSIDTPSILSGSPWSLQSLYIRLFDTKPRYGRLLDRILAEDTRLKSVKESEWKEKQQRYEQLTREYIAGKCQDADGTISDNHRNNYQLKCRRCFLYRERRRLVIDVHESWLPDDLNRQKAIVVELVLPRSLIAWRDATMQLLRLGHGTPIGGAKPESELCKHPKLGPLSANADSRVLKMASKAKIFGKTHYRKQKLPVGLRSILLPHGASWELWDSRSEIWMKEYPADVNLAALCTPEVQQDSSFFPIRRYLQPCLPEAEFNANQALANQSSCPRGLDSSEFVGFQLLRIGTRLPWINLLRELASLNLNFGLREVYLLVRQLALVTGPLDRQENLRDAHSVLHIPQFRTALCLQLQDRMARIQPNWRESQMMEMCIMLAYRVWSLSINDQTRQVARETLLLARRITSKWLHDLRSKPEQLCDILAVRSRSESMLKIALLNRSTFILEAEDDQAEFKDGEIEIFITSTLIRWQSLGDLKSSANIELGPTIREMFIRDVRLVHRLEYRLKYAILRGGSAIAQAVNDHLQQTTDDARYRFGTWTFLESPYDTWVMTTMTTDEQSIPQPIHLELLEGNIMIAHHSISQLPVDFTSLQFFQRFFGEEVLRTVRSNLGGMQHMLIGLRQGHQVHFGYRGSLPVMRARFRGSTLEYLSPDFFRGVDGKGPSDLPECLIDNHVHWLELGTRRVLVRPEKTMWKSKDSDWIINLVTREALRRTSLLVDPNSILESHFSRIIDPFEVPGQLIIFQPRKRNLSVQLPKLDLVFRVDEEGRLESEELRARIDFDQDIGTLYGLDSKLVLQDISAPFGRSVVIPTGEALISRGNLHVCVRMRHKGYYARYRINPLLGRLECATGPRLIYFKAYCHAVTSMTGPDPLTNRTGASEALSCLTAANAQPWAPLRERDYRLLVQIAALTPRYHWYPKSMKVNQIIDWNSALSVAAQDDAFRPTIRGILRQCEDLLPLFPKAEPVIQADDDGDDALLQRAKVRCDAYRVIVHRSEHPLTASTLDFKPRDHGRSARSGRTYSISRSLTTWSMPSTVEVDIVKKCKDWRTMAGFQYGSEHVLLADLLDLSYATSWGLLFAECQRATGSDGQDGLIFTLAAAAFDKHADLKLLRSLVAIAVSDDFRTIKWPKGSAFINYVPGEKMTKQLLIEMMDQQRVPYSTDAQNSGYRLSGSRLRKSLGDERAHRQLSADACGVFADWLLKRWPCEIPSTLEFEGDPLFDHETACEMIESEWNRIYTNWGLDLHLQEVNSLLSCMMLPIDGGQLSEPSANEQLLPLLPTSNKRISLQRLQLECNTSSTEAQLIEITIPLASLALDVTSSVEQPEPHRVTKRTSNVNQHVHELKAINARLRCKTDPIRQQYASELDNSIRALEINETSETLPMNEPLTNPQLHSSFPNTDESERLLRRHFVIVKEALEADRSLWEKLYLPDITIITLLELLRRGPKSDETSPFYSVILRFAQQLVRHQHSQRRQTALALKVKSELSDPGRLAGPLHNHPEWLLLQIDFDVMIRPVQYRVADAMILPASRSNSLLQMNMGQGKSSIIIPMIATVLGDGKNLVRVVVPQPLLQQSAQLLQSRLGGLVGRKVKHLPYSRRISARAQTCGTYQKLHAESSVSGDIVLTTPESLLSFKLSGIQRLIDGKIKEAGEMLRVQSWLDRTSRDVFDECDQMLAVQTQMIYPSGTQSLIDGHPDRWKTVQGLLQLVRLEVTEMKPQFRERIEIIRRSATSFPTIYFLDHQVQKKCVEGVARRVVAGDGAIIPSRQWSGPARQLAYRFIVQVVLPTDDKGKLCADLSHNPQVYHTLLHVRGMLAHGILLMGLNKRWNVQYGIHPGRDPVAVPFRSKGVPSEQAEFGHPDVTILLTCLSFYQGGITRDLLRRCLQKLIKSDEPARGYDQWIRELEYVPPQFRFWNTLDPDDETQCAGLWTLLRYQTGLINFFLNHLVFPVHARTFKRKIVSSGWDLPSPNVELGSHSSLTTGPLTVGFSGTNDGRSLLPLNIQQQDLAGLSHTNAEVLTYLLQPRNRRYQPTVDRNGRRLTEHEFLDCLCEQRIRILIDSGALIIELSNFQVARKWLDIDHEAKAAVYFDEKDQALILYRDNRYQPLATSPYHENFGECLVYLDQAHTRGIDLKLPTEAVAALTLGVMQTKDHTVQGRPTIPNYSLMHC